MSTQTRPFSESLLALLNALARGGSGHILEVHARSSGGVGYRVVRLPIPDEAWRFLPAAVLEIVEQPWAARIAAGMRRADAQSRLVSVSVAFAVFPIAVRFDRDTDWRHQADAAVRDAALARLEAFPLSPGFLIDALDTLVPLWPLSEPLLDLEQARHLQRRLADVLDASRAPVRLPIPSSAGPSRVIEYATNDPAAHLPMPGAIVRDMGDPAPVVTFAAADPARVYTLNEFEAALGLEVRA
jgi:hypothetical protein